MESVQFQIDLLSEINVCCSDVLIQTIINFEDTQKDLEKLVEITTLGDVETIANELDRELENEHLKHYYDLMIYSRNDDMTLKAIEYLDSNDVYFIAVGAAHVVGKTEIINQLEQLGYKITRL